MLKQLFRGQGCTQQVRRFQGFCMNFLGESILGFWLSGHKIVAIFCRILDYGFPTLCPSFRTDIQIFIQFTNTSVIVQTFVM